MQSKDEKIIVSACLAGIECRYDGKNNLVEEIREMFIKGDAIALCPEELGGLPTPRIPCEIRNTDNGKEIYNREQENCTYYFIKGAQKVAEIAKIINCKKAILKANSPSCGYGQIYDGSFTGTYCKGDGFTTQKLIKMGITIYNEKNFKF